MSGLTLSGLRLTGPQGRLLDDVSFRVEAGQVLAIVGASGSGKSLTLRGCLGLAPPGTRIRGGTVQVDEQSTPLDPLPRAAARWLRGPALGWVPQGGGLDPLLTVGRLLARARRQRAGAPSVLSLLEQVGLPASTRRALPHELSGGMRQRAAFAVLLARGSRHWLLDEPTAALDPQSAARVLETARGHAAAGHAVVLVSHDLARLATVADQLLVLHQGRVVEDLPVSRLDSLRSGPGRALLHALSADVDAWERAGEGAP